MKHKRVLRVFEIMHTVYRKNLIWQIGNVSIQAGSPIEAGSLIQAEGV